MSETNITFVLAVYNNLSLTEECYSNLRKIYPNIPLVISSGGSNDGTYEWLVKTSITDENLTFVHETKKINFSENYNQGIKLVDTELLVLIHNDMVIGEGFIDGIINNSKPNRLLCYTTIEPPIFQGHDRPGKISLDCGNDFNTFDFKLFNSYVKEIKKNKNLSDGGSFFMSGYKNIFDDIGYFDGFTFFPCFCEDDDFLLRTKIKGYEIVTTNEAIVYHFVSKTSRFSNEYKDSTYKNEVNSGRNFIRKWGIPHVLYEKYKYWEEKNFKYYNYNISLKINNSIYNKYINHLEPYFDTIICSEIPEDYIISQESLTNYDIRNKFISTKKTDVIININQNFENSDFDIIKKIRFILPSYEMGSYQSGNLLIEILN
jgi:GT2 family glycosyltransferase